MNVWTGALLITLICVIVIDVSGFVQDMEGLLGKWLHCKVRIPKPFSCSFCMSFWVNVFYSIFSGAFGIGFIAYALSLSVLTPVIAGAVWNIRDMIGDLITVILNFYKHV